MSLVNLAFICGFKFHVHLFSQQFFLIADKNSQRSLVDCGFVQIDNMTAEEIKSRGLVSVSQLTSETTSNIGSSISGGVRSGRPSRRGRPRVITLLPPSSPTLRHAGRPEKYANWFEEGLFPPIIQAMKETRGNFSKTIKLLNARYKNGLTNRSPYAGLSRSTLSSWFHRKTKKLLPHVSEYMANLSPYKKNKRFSIFGSSEVVDALKDMVEKQRALGLQIFSLV